MSDKEIVDIWARLSSEQKRMFLCEAESCGSYFPAVAIASALMDAGALRHSDLLGKIDVIISGSSGAYGISDLERSLLQPLLAFRETLQALVDDRPHRYGPSPEDRTAQERLKAAAQPPNPEEDQG